MFRHFTPVVFNADPGDHLC